MYPAIKAGLVYFALGFGVGFVLGTLRVLVMIPRVGELTAVLLELPLILTATWIICRQLTRRFEVPPVLAPRLVMGATAFALLGAAEFTLSVTVFGRAAEDYLMGFLTLPGSLGLAGQALFGFFPAIQAASPNKLH